ncbi:c-type cytochrome [Neopusillimonas maritima]|nr:c-type cytochrome [Neopusillimonas maritima]
MKRVLSKMLVTSGLLLGSSLLGVSYAADVIVSKPDAAKGEQLYTNGDSSRGILACVTCHGPGGNSTLPANPNLAGMSHEYIAKQLRDFKSEGNDPPTRAGADGNPSAMTAIANPLTEEDIKNVSYYLALQELNYETAATATNVETMERGQKIWRAGIAERGVPACAACHSPNGAGIPALFPRLAGQYPSYLEAQLKLFRSNDRANSPMMHDIADRMSDNDISAVADYAAGLR